MDRLPGIAPEDMRGDRSKNLFVYLYENAMVVYIRFHLAVQYRNIPQVLMQYGINQLMDTSDRKNANAGRLEELLDWGSASPSLLGDSSLASYCPASMGIIHT